MPKEPNAFPFVVIVAGRKSGETAAVPPRTIVASSAPGSSLRRPILRWSRKYGTPSQNTSEPTIPDRDEHGPAAGVAELGLRDHDDRVERAGEDEEEDRVERLIGRLIRPDAPGARVDVLVELADPDSPEEKVTTIVSEAARAFDEALPNCSGRGSPCPRSGSGG